MLSGCHNHYGYEPQYGDVAAGESVTEAEMAKANSFRTYVEWAPAVAHKKGMYNKEGEPIDMYVSSPLSSLPRLPTIFAPYVN